MHKTESGWIRLAIRICCFVALLSATGCRCVTMPWEGASPSWNNAREFDVDRKHATGEPVKGLVIGISRPLMGGSDVISVVLRNEADHPITVYRSFRVDTGQFDADSDLFFLVTEKTTGAKAELLTRAWTDSSDHHNPRCYYQMAPKEIVSQTLAVGKFYKMFPGSVYDVSVEYDHRESGFQQSGQWIEMNAWTGRCRSNHVNLSPPDQ
jgi:hypothetical protein